ncbi:hypothetical protein M3P21_17255 [Ruegeria sp. 2012CJ41-6]|uniref:DUF998 domain-containing protein n=1 Tax=Ruegeria spongiae TaxID=2942209 RepID=A0ABT0Q5Y8_9RHOB|nr:hypothetical protein [Ruegeria spongiae]MCL6285279.1 hypothetical protein [Ruegeria spongiae]
MQSFWRVQFAKPTQICNNFMNVLCQFIHEVTSMVPFELPSSRFAMGRLSVEFYFIASGCAVLVLMAYLLEYQAVSNGFHSVPKILQEFNLGQENNLAAWFSGALLAVIALHAMDGHTLFRSVAPRVARAWVLIASVLLFLSADEIGSLHERLSGIGRSMGVGSWGLLLPLGAVLAIVLLWAMATLWRAGGAQRKQALILMAGFALLGSVAVQEFLEHALTWDSAHASAARIAIEEGSELLGMLILLGVAISNSAGLFADRYGHHGTLFEVLVERRRGLLITLIVAAPAISYLTAGLQDPGRGRPADWLASMAFLSAAAVAAGPWLQDRNGNAALVTVSLLLALSCACIAISPDGIIETAIMTTTRRAVLLVVLIVILLAASYWSGHWKISPVRLIILAGVCGALLALSESRVIAFLLTIALGAVIYLEMSLAQETEPRLDREV